MLELQKLKQLSTIQEHAAKNLHMQPIKLNDAQKIPKIVENSPKELAC